MNAPLDTAANNGVGRGSRWLWPPLTVALLTVAGSLALSLHLGLKACPLCFYQRTFAMSAAAVLLMGATTRERDARLLGLLVWPLVVAGLGLAAFHVYLEAAGKLECPAGLAGIGSAPQQSLAAYVVLFVSLLPSLAGTCAAYCCRATSLFGGAATKPGGVRRAVRLAAAVAGRDMRRLLLPRDVPLRRRGAGRPVGLCLRRQFAAAATGERAQPAARRLPRAVRARSGGGRSQRVVISPCPLDRSTAAA